MSQYPFDGLTGGGNALDGIPYAGLNALSKAYGMYDGVFYTYQYNTTSTLTEDAPWVIKPDDNSGAGRWLLVTELTAGYTWEAQASAADNEWYGVCYGNGLFVAVGYTGTLNRVMTSPDGINWTIGVTPVDIQWRAVCYADGLFVAVANTGTTNRVMTSPDGITWTLQTSVNRAHNDICYAEGLFVACLGGGTGTRIVTSPDGVNWTFRTTPVDNVWFAICYGNGLFVAVSTSGTGNRVMTSPDGITWTSRTSAEDNDWRGVCYGNGLFVAVAFDGTNRLMTSPDGITWTARSMAAYGWNRVIYANGHFIAVTGSAIGISKDGINWTYRTNPTGNATRNVTFGNGIFVAVASSGTGDRVITSGKALINEISHNNIWQSEIILPFTSTPASASASGIAGQIAFDGNYIYRCVATDTWKRAAIATW
jgi:hypothetical protein